MQMVPQQGKRRLESPCGYPRKTKRKKKKLKMKAGIVHDGGNPFFVNKSERVASHPVAATKPGPSLVSDSLYVQHDKQNKMEPTQHKSTDNDRALLKSHRRLLPVWPARGRIISQVRHLDSVIIIGETGCGKTTQIPQFLFETGLHRKLMIACTQPRRVAAITVAERVALERGCELGHQVGFSVRFQDVTSEFTRIKYMTDGMLLREAILDPLLKRYSIVVLDEAHERSLHTDVLFGVVKAAQSKRRVKGILPLKVIVMSATMDVDHFAAYFNQAHVLYLEGRQFPVTIQYVKQPQSDYLFACLIAVFQIHKETPPGHDILVFLTGQDEIESAVRSLRSIAKDPSLKDHPEMNVYPLYAALPQTQQLLAFSPTPQGHRKVVVATNIAETSITIHGIKYVIDSGMVKERKYNATSGLDMLKVQRVSKAQAWQRSGRAGRESPGTCYRLYTLQEYEAMATTTVPELLRCSLSAVALQLLAMGINNVRTFDFMDKPDPKALEQALEELVLLGAVEAKDNTKLTQLGRQMAAFPTDPRLAKVLIAAVQYKCLEEILSIVSLLSVESVLVSPRNKKEEVAQVWKKFFSSEGDHITLLKVYRACNSVKRNKDWCKENFISRRNIKMASEVRQQLKQICVRLHLPLQSCGQDSTTIRKCLTQGFYMNAAELSREGEYRTILSRKKVSIHPSSALFMCKPACVLYNELVWTTKAYMRTLCVVDPDWLLEAAPHLFKQRHRSS